ncbi:hypothetical protein JW933_11500, partial [candidate division FCPU426 bacterium]|nr:hypothetical protein [candidate division FCPU426 bacterium]
MHKPQGLSTSAKKVAAVDFYFPLPPWQKDISGSPDRKDYWEEKRRLRRNSRNLVVIVIMEMAGNLRYRGYASSHGGLHPQRRLT